MSGKAGEKSDQRYSLIMCGFMMLVSDSAWFEMRKRYKENYILDEYAFVM